MSYFTKNFLTIILYIDIFFQGESSLDRFFFYTLHSSVAKNSGVFTHEGAK